MQLVIISGKGGTGKTTIAASFAHLSSSELIKVDCDVDASNLHLMFNGKNIHNQSFTGAKVAKLQTEKCTFCRKCEQVCRFNAIDTIDRYIKINSLRCEGCGACMLVCEEGAILLEEEVTGSTIITESSQGIISHAEMIPGAEGSGKLVTQVRNNARKWAGGDNADFIIDASPGVGCAVMASITGCDYCVLVTEPTIAAFEDFKRIYELTTHFGIRSIMIINKYDINEEISDEIERFCLDIGLEVVGKIPFDHLVEKSINEGRPVVMYENSIAGQTIRKIWYEEIEKKMGG